MAVRRRPTVLAQLLSGQQSLFTPRPADPTSLDDLCPPVEQLQLDVDAANRAGSQTTIDDFTTRDA